MVTVILLYFDNILLSMSDKFRMIPTKLLSTSAFASGTEASGTIGTAGDDFVYELYSVYTQLTLGSDAGVRKPSIEILDAVGGDVIFSVGCANSGCSVPSTTNKISASVGVASRSWGGGAGVIDHQVMELPSYQGGGMLVGGGTVVRTSTQDLDATGNADTYGKLIVYGRILKKQR